MKLTKLMREALLAAYCNETYKQFNKRTVYALMDRGLATLSKGRFSLTNAGHKVAEELTARSK